MHLAICLWGLLRSLPHTIKSFEKYILQPLRKYDFTYDIFLHTYQLNGSYSSARNKETHIELNISNYYLLAPQYVFIENQATFDQQINYLLYQQVGDPWKNSFESFKNHLRALNSLYHVTKVVESLVQSGIIHYDGIIFVRPDVEFLQPLPIELLPIYYDQQFSSILDHHLQISASKPLPAREPHEEESLNPSITTITTTKTIASNPTANPEGALQPESVSSQNPPPGRGRAMITNEPLEPLNKKNLDKLIPVHEVLYLPDFHRSCQGYEYNDRMAMGTIQSGLLYGKKFESAYEYSLHHLLHAEKFTYYHLTELHHLRPIEISFRFRRIRSNGDIHIRDYEAITPDEQYDLTKKGIYFVGKGSRTPLHLRYFYSFLEVITFYQKYVWNRDDHGNIFCHPQIYIQYSEYLKYLSIFQQFYEQYQEHLFYLTSSALGAAIAAAAAENGRLLNQTFPLSHRRSALGTQTATMNATGVNTVDDAQKVLASGRIPSPLSGLITNGESLLHTQQYLHRQKKYSLYFQDKQRKITCQYELVKKAVNAANHHPHKRSKHHSHQSTSSETDRNQYITSYLLPVNCTITYTLKPHHRPTTQVPSSPHFSRKQQTTSYGYHDYDISAQFFDTSNGTVAHGDLSRGKKGRIIYPDDDTTNTNGSPPHYYLRKRKTPRHEVRGSINNNNYLNNNHDSEDRKLSR